MESAASRLVAPSLALADEYRAMIDESVALGEDCFPRLFAFLGYSLDDHEGVIAAMPAMAEEPASEQIVPSSTFWLVQGDRLLGECRVRHRLNDRLLHHGGHIGYIVRPSARGQGHGKRMLALALDEARRMGLVRVLLTCDQTNLGSAGVIRANGGVLEDEPVSRFTGRVISRYWITL